MFSKNVPYRDRTIWFSQNDCFCFKNVFSQTAIKSYQQNLKSLKMKRLWIPLNLALSSQNIDYTKILIIVKTQTYFSIYARMNLIIMLHEKKKNIRRNNKSFMTKTLSKSIMERMRFRNKFLENPEKKNCNILLKK